MGQRERRERRERECANTDTAGAESSRNKSMVSGEDEVHWALRFVANLSAVIGPDKKRRPDRIRT
jgi:hypothetical protein